MSFPESCGSIEAELWGPTEPWFPHLPNQAKDIFCFRNSEVPLLSSPLLLRSTDSGAGETNKIQLKGSEEKRDEENENNDLGKEQRECRRRGDRALPVPLGGREEDSQWQGHLQARRPF